MMNTYTTAVSVMSNATLRFVEVPKSTQFLKQIEAFVEQLVEKSKVDGLELTFAHEENLSPAYRASIVLAVPGPDMRIEHRGATLAEAWQKVCDDVMKKLRDRDAKRVASRKRSEPIRMGSH